MVVTRAGRGFPVVVRWQAFDAVSFVRRALAEQAIEASAFGVVRSGWRGKEVRLDVALQGQQMPRRPKESDWQRPKIGGGCCSGG